MGLLSYSPYGYDPNDPRLRNVTPFVQPQAPQGQGAGPQMFPQAAPQPQPAPAPAQPNRMQSAWQGLLGTGGLKPGASLQERMSAVADGPLFNTGMALIAASAPGATGADFVNHMQNYRQNQLQREQMRRQEWRENRADKQNDVAFGRQQTEWNRQDQSEQAFQAAVNNAPDEPTRQMLRAMGREGYADYVTRQQEIDFQRERARVQDSQFQQSLAIDRARLANDRYTNSFAAAAGREEAGYVAGMRGRLDNWRMVDNDIARIEYWLTERPDVFNSLLDGTEEEVLRRYTRRGDQQALTAAQELYGIGSSLAREELRGQTPVSNIDFLAALRGNPTTASSTQFVRNWIDRARQDRRMMEEQYQSALAHGQEFGNLSAVNPATGRNYYQDTYNRYGGGGSSGGDAASAPRGGRERWSDYQARTGGASAQSQRQWPTPSSAAVAELRRDTSAEARREFDQMFGPGAAARALQGGGGRIAVMPRG